MNALKVAVLIRTHLVCQKLYHLIDCLRGSQMFDLYILVDETQNKLDVTGTSVVSYNVQMCAEMGLKINPINHSNVLWLCGDYSIYCAQKILDSYDFYIIIEYDVNFVRHNPLFVEQIINRLGHNNGEQLDFVCPSVRIYPQGNWRRAAARLYDRVYWSGLFSFIVMSSRASHFLLKARLYEGVNPAALCELTHCETFALTALMDAGMFRCAGLDALAPGCINSKTFHASHADLTRPNYLLGTIIDDDPRVELNHPVLDAEQYLDKLWTYYVRANKDPVNFIEHIKSLDPLLVPPNVRRRYTARAVQAAERLSDNALGASHSADRSDGTTRGTASLSIA